MLYNGKGDFNGKKKKSGKSKKSGKCSCECCAARNDQHAHLPGYLLIAFGLLALPINFGMIEPLEFAKAWPLLLVIFGFVLLAKVQICRIKKITDF